MAAHGSWHLLGWARADRQAVAEFIHGVECYANTVCIVARHDLETGVGIVLRDS